MEEEMGTLTFDTNIDSSTDNGHNVQATHQIEHVPDQTKVPDQTDQMTIIQGTDNHRDIPIEPHRSTCVSQPTNTKLQSMEYQNREAEGKGVGQDWATNTKNPRVLMVIDGSDDNDNAFACLADTKSTYHIPRSYKHTTAMDQEWWMLPMKVEMDTLKLKHTWDLVKPPPRVKVMDSMWVYDIKWDGKGNQIKDKAWLVGKGYTQQLGINYNETWAGVTRLESVWMTAAVAAKFDLKLWCIDFVGAYLNSLTKEARGFCWTRIQRLCLQTHPYDLWYNAGSMRLVWDTQ